MKEERLGITLIILQQILFTLETAAVHQLAGALTAVQLGLLRSVGGLAVALCLAPTVGWSVLKTSRPGLQILRAIAALAYLWVMMFSFSHIPFADATAISYTQVLYVALFAGPILGEVLGARKCLSIVIGFAGALLIIKPGFSQVSALYAAILVGTALNGLGLVLNRYLCREDSSITVMLYVNLACVFGFLPGLADPWQTINTLPWLTVVVVAGPIGMYVGIVAVRYADASVVAPYLYLRLVLAIIGASLLFGEAPNLLSICGAILIAAACMLADKSFVQLLLRFHRKLTS